MSKFSKGPWSIKRRDRPTDAYRVRHVVNALGHTLAVLTESKASDDDAKLIAAAPDGLSAAELTYMALLAIDGAWRVKNQHVYCALRDYIAAASGRDVEEVQNDFEARAALARAQG